MLKFDILFSDYLIVVINMKVYYYLYYSTKLMIYLQVVKESKIPFCKQCCAAG